MMAAAELRELEVAETIAVLYKCGEKLTDRNEVRPTQHYNNAV